MTEELSSVWSDCRRMYSGQWYSQAQVSVDWFIQDNKIIVLFKMLGASKWKYSFSCTMFLSGKYPKNRITIRSLTTTYFVTKSK